MLLLEVLYWVIWGIIGLAVVYGVLQWLGLFAWSFVENGKSFTIKLLILFILFIIPSQAKDYAPEFYGASIWLLVLYCVALLGLRLFTKGLDPKEID